MTPDPMLVTKYEYRRSVALLEEDTGHGVLVGDLSEADGWSYVTSSILRDGWLLAEDNDGMVSDLGTLPDDEGGRTIHYMFRPGAEDSDGASLFSVMALLSRIEQGMA